MKVYKPHCESLKPAISPLLHCLALHAQTPHETFAHEPASSNVFGLAAHKVTNQDLSSQQALGIVMRYKHDVHQACNNNPQTQQTIGGN